MSGKGVSAHENDRQRGLAISKMSRLTDAASSNGRYRFPNSRGWELQAQRVIPILIVSARHEKKSSRRRAYEPKAILKFCDFSSKVILYSRIPCVRSARISP